ncbi:PKD domain-containing protein [Corallococcus praedator]|uniref:PKD domain-containing protein n=1 Tax=Corallococcus praedator TaxID=2316724 RepID=A0ABX9QHT0_9BACT|nr:MULTISPECIES: PKD domain-containing protein [Corallococcus]RKH30487.1 PKD domain-containing protein [Corallococcus sp. CA031C]RKI08501.1 PKD domain-containing protein [Corallococcus praedator]
MVLAAGGVFAGSLLLAGLEATRTDNAGPESPVRPDALVPPERAVSGLETPALAARPPPVDEEGTTEDARLASALGEIWEPLASTAFIEQLDTDRPWACAGGAVSVVAKVGGPREPDLVERWVWPTPEGRAGLQPGSGLDWRAPAVPGRYPVRFQLCRDLGGRRVGVVAERTVLLEVRDCEAEAESPLRLGARQDGPATFTFEVQGLEEAGPVRAYTWDLGDGTTEETEGPILEHTYAVEPADGAVPRRFTVRVRAQMESGAPRSITTFVGVRPLALPEAPPRVALKVSRWQPLVETGGWRSEVSVLIPDGAEAVTWAEVERILVGWDDQRRATRMPWERALTVQETLERGGFRAAVVVGPDEATPDIKQVLDVLHGRDARGNDVVVSWASFKQEQP